MRRTMTLTASAAQNARRKLEKCSTKKTNKVVALRAGGGSVGYLLLPNADDDGGASERAAPDGKGGPDAMEGRGGQPPPKATMAHSSLVPEPR